MRELILQMQASADGFVAAKSPRRWQLWDWGDDNRWDDELKCDFNAFMAMVSAILLSRKMAEEGYLTHWGEAAEAHRADPFYAFARRIVETDKIVLSDRLSRLRWERTTVGSGDLPKEVGALKANGDGVIAVFGGVGFASALLAADLVDEIQLYVNPVALGGGAGLFRLVGFRALKLLGSKSYDCGMVVSRYAPARGN